MLLQRIGIEHLRIWIFLIILSLAQSLFIREHRKDDYSLFSYDYDDTPKDPEETYQNFKTLCLSKSKSSGGSSFLDALCSTALKKSH